MAARKVPAMALGTHEPNRSTDAGIGRSVPPPLLQAASQDPEEERLTVLPPIVWAAGIGGVVAVILLAG
jgi:hypothetical protein